MQKDPIQAAANHFDQASATWDENPARAEMAKRHVEAICRHIPLNQQMRVLDYGCGTGLVSLGILPKVGRLLGLDGSPGMVARFNEKIGVLGVHNCEARPFDPSRELLPGVADASFDLIVSTMTFHHIPDIRAVLREFRRALAPGGRVCVIDLETEDGSFHEDPNAGAVHHGFSAQELREAFADAGLKNPTVEPAFVHERPRTGSRYPILIAIGTS